MVLVFFSAPEGVQCLCNLCFTTFFDFDFLMAGEPGVVREHGMDGAWFRTDEAVGDARGGIISRQLSPKDTHMSSSCFRLMKASIVKSEAHVLSK